MSSFSTFKLLPTLESSLLEKGFVKPTEIQEKSLPILLEGQSVVGVSETGSGKTLAYGLPLLQKLKMMENAGDPVTLEGQPRAAIIVPTRELGEQVSRVLKPFTHTTRLRVRTLLGGTTVEVAKKNVKGSFEILVATPGRLVKFIDRSLVNLSDVRLLIFDEADQMLDQGFLNDAMRIAKECSPECQLGLFTATLSPSIQSLIRQLFSKAQVIRSAGSHKVVPTLTTSNRQVKDGKRFLLLREVLSEECPGGTLIFSNTRAQCDKLSELLKEAGYSFLLYRGEMEKVERRANLKAFREGKVKLLIATDLASRGLDVDRVERVINYHLPQDLENYIHRVGRTARAGREGLVINLVTERDALLMNKIANSRA